MVIEPKTITLNGEEITITITPFSGWIGTKTLIKLFHFGVKNVEVFDCFDTSSFKGKSEESSSEKLKNTLEKDIDFKKLSKVILTNSSESELERWIKDLTDRTVVAYHDEAGQEHIHHLNNKNDFDIAMSGRVSLLMHIIPEVLIVNYGSLKEVWNGFLDHMENRE